MSHLYALRKAAAEAKLDDLDPEWKSRFGGDWQRAEDFYRRPSRLIHHSTATDPAEYSDKREEDVDFDDGFEGDVRE